jgi:uncharacterized protein (DUF58 family)
MIKVNKKIVFLCIVAFIFAYISGGNLPYSLFYIFAITIVFGIIFMRMANKNFHAKFKYDSRFYNVSDSAKFTIIVENLGVIPAPYVYVESKVLHELIEEYRGDLISLGVDKKKWINNEIVFKRRGIYDFSDISLETNDLFCIFKSVKNIHNELEIMVYPKVYDLRGTSIGGRDSYENLINSKSGIDDFTLIKDIKKYNVGDNLKKVHWKLSAKHGELYVKNFDAISGKECNLFINMHIDNVSNNLNEIIEEHMVDFAVSLTKLMMDTKIKTRLFVHAKEQKNIEVEFKEEFLGVMNYFLKCKSDATTAFYNFINLNIRHVPKGKWIGIISIAVDDNLRNVIMNLKEMGYKVSVFYYGNPVYEYKNINLLENLGIECINFKEVKERR